MCIICSVILGSANFVLMLMKMSREIIAEFIIDILFILPHRTFENLLPCFKMACRLIMAKRMIRNVLAMAMNI